VQQRRRILRHGAALAAAAAFGPARAADPFPSHPLTLYVSFGPGGVGDIVARIVAEQLTKGLGQAVVVENRPIPVMGPTLVAKARPDGYTMVVSGNGTAVTAALFNTLPFDVMKDFAHVSTMASFDMALIAPADSKFGSLGDALAFARANPGRLNVGSARVGSTQNLAAEMLRAMAGIDVVLVPYKAPGDIIAALHSGDIQLALEHLPAVRSQITARNVKALAVTSAKRFSGLPQVPTIAESGVPGFEATSWLGISVPAHTPQPVVDRLAKELQAAVATPQVRKALQTASIDPESSTPQQMTDRMRNDLAKWRAVIDKAGIPKQ
jgi:tripartite-type tricarboxylate transporter receptor subunit TctC